MKRFGINTVLIAGLCGIGALYFMWYQVIIWSFLIGYWRPQRGEKAFGSGFLGVGLLWGVTAAIIDYENGHVLSQKLIALFGLPHPFLFVLLTAVIGGVAGGMAALTGAYGRRLLRK